MSETKTCPHCQQPFVRAPGESPANWSKRKHCSQSCSNHSREWSPSEPDPSMSKVCLFCQTRMTRRPREAISDWHRRRFCRAACASKDWAQRSPEHRVAEDDESDFAMSWQQIGEQLGMTKEGARRIGERAMRKLRRACEQHGISPDAIYLSRGVP